MTESTSALPSPASAKDVLSVCCIVSVAFQGPNHALGLTPLAANLVPDSLGNQPRPRPFGLNAKLLDSPPTPVFAGLGRIATPVVDHQLRRRLLTKDRPVACKGLERHLPLVREGASPGWLLRLGKPLRHSIQPLFRNALYFIREYLSLIQFILFYLQHKNEVNYCFRY